MSITTFFFNIQARCSGEWCRYVMPVIQEAEVGGLKSEASSRQKCETLSEKQRKAKVLPASVKLPLAVRS
jgi:hypothetical protein